MRYPASEKLEIIRLVEQSHLPAKQTLDKLGIPRTTFYRWYDKYLTGGVEALEDRSPRPLKVWNRIPDDVRERVVDMALDVPELSPRELAVRFTDTQRYFVSESSVYRMLKAYDLITSPAYAVIKAASEFREKTTAINEMWQADKASKSTSFRRCYGSSYISGELANWLNEHGMDHVRGAPYHPQTQGKIERWHQTLKNRILLENYFLPSDLEQQIEAFVTHYNHHRYHESLSNLTPADVYFGRGETILLERERIKRYTINQRHLQYRNQAA